MRQLSFAFQMHEDTLRSFFEKALDKPVSLTVTDNTTSMLTARTEKRALSLRIHRMFLHAGGDVLSEIAAYLDGRKKSTPLMREHIRRNEHLLARTRARRSRIVSRGVHHDLGTIFDALNAEYFEGRLRATVTWGIRPSRRSVRKRTLGSYNPHSRTIRISPTLDARSVPHYFLSFVLYHEMLHAALGIESGEGRRTVHTAAFRAREKLFRHYEKAVAWEKKRW